MTINQYRVLGWIALISSFLVEQQSTERRFLGIIGIFFFGTALYKSFKKWQESKESDE